MNGSVTLHLLGQARRIIGGPFDSWDGNGIGLCLDPTAAKRQSATILLDLADFTAPTESQLQTTLSSLLEAMRAHPAAPVYIGCKAGYGRTGTFIAALAKLAGHPEPIAWTRRHYHPSAVETNAQEAAIAAFTPAPEAP